ncbi:anti-sigma factor [Paraburkholderia sp. ZP32-5]|uniref:anti-sigma factor n=1 Tax=Paraburkholderia sp. ZP32-5 TaxID=2883245 RepID=UPI001F1BC927|nr:anti-sigma factor [Paraburkholderia sp. ZP32-5]
MTEIDDTLLMAYVDGELPPQDRREIESSIAASPDLAERVALFSASRLPFREAFAQQKLPPVPDSLKNTIEQMARAHAAQPVDSSANDARINHDAQLPPSAPVRSRLRIAPAWLAVAFVAGAFCFGAVLRFAPGIAPGVNVGGDSMASVATGASPWVQAAAGYQQLYARETIAQMPVDAGTLPQSIEQIRREDQLALRIPDLSEAGLTFKRVQRLRFNGRALIQIEYLPENGAPIALCVIKEAKPDQAVASQRVGDMDVVTWRQAELGYALIGNSQGVDLAALGKRIANRSVEQLFGAVNGEASVRPIG